MGLDLKVLIVTVIPCNMLNFVLVKVPVRTFHFTGTRHICALELVLPARTAHCVACEFHPHWISCRTAKGTGRECGSV